MKCETITNKHETINITSHVSRIIKSVSLRLIRQIRVLFLNEKIYALYYRGFRATCWEEGKTSDQMEIIEIGAVVLESSIGPILEEFNTFVRPVIHPVLSVYCMRLTSIRQQDVDKADDFKTVFRDFVDWIGSQPFNLCSWGAYDLKQFKIDCERQQIRLPASFSQHINLKQEFADLKRIKPCSMAKALNILGIKLEGTHHRAIDDVRNIAKIAVHVLPIVEKSRLGD